MSSFGRFFRVTTFGESHGGGVGCIVEGVPPRMALTENDIQCQLDRRRPGQSNLTTQRKEADRVSILSGTEFGVTLGTPIACVVKNEDHRPGDYGKGGMIDIPRPSHADYTYQAKYGVRASSGGGRASARETIGRVAAGAIAEKWLREAYQIEIVAWVSSVANIHAPADLQENVHRAQVDASGPARCPHAESAEKMTALITEAKAANDSLGGVITCVVRNVPAGWGEPCFDKLEALLAHAMMSIPSTKGFEIGSGFEGTTLRGSQHNDMFTKAKPPSHANGSESATSPPVFSAPTAHPLSAFASARSSSSPSSSSSSSSILSVQGVDHLNGQHLDTVTNRSGGIQGGISNGAPLLMRIAFKPAATISLAQHTVDFDGEAATLRAEGRHDPCVLPRAIPIVEAMTALVLADVALQQEARVASASIYPLMAKVRPQHAQSLKDELSK